MGQTPTTKDHISNGFKQLLLIEMEASGVCSQMARSSTDKHFCQSELQGTVENRFFEAGAVACDISW